MAKRDLVSSSIPPRGYNKKSKYLHLPARDKGRDNSFLPCDMQVFVTRGATTANGHESNISSLPQAKTCFRNASAAFSKRPVDCVRPYPFITRQQTEMRTCRSTLPVPHVSDKRKSKSHTSLGPKGNIAHPRVSQTPQDELKFSRTKKKGSIQKNRGQHPFQK